MASKPGILTHWPWTTLGSFKYLVMAPGALQTIFALATQPTHQWDYTNLLTIPFLLSRAIHNQIWISYSRYRTATGRARILDRSIEFDQIDRESNWDDQILLTGILLYFFNNLTGKASFLPAWRMDGVIITALVHALVVEYLYYWLHRALHHHFLYSRYHSHHHSSIVTEPITSVIHPFAEHLAYFILFAIPLLGTIFTETASLASIYGYITFIDFMNNLGHCNFEIVPSWVFTIFPPLKYIMYTPSFHSLHHTQFRTNYSLFMPFYDYIHGTTDNSSDELFEKSLNRPEECPDVVHLTHLTTPESIFHLPIGLASFAARPQSSKWCTRLLMGPFSLWTMMLNFITGKTLVVERNFMEKLKLQTWAVPRYTIQYTLKWQEKAINKMIEEAINRAEARGVKVLSLGLLNQVKEPKRNGQLFIVKKQPNQKMKIIDGSSLAVAVVINSIPKGTTEIMFRGKLCKTAHAIIGALLEKGIQIAAMYENERLKLAGRFTGREVIVPKSFTQKVWIVGEGLTKEEQLKAPKGAVFIPYSQFPPKQARRDAVYCLTPSMMAPPSLKNLHSCENWLPRRAMSAWRVAGILHAIEEWNVDEYGDAIFDHNKIWEAALKHGFRLLPGPA
ncbi:hypothetical protein M569_09713, partial [Genlisea aurea]